MLAALSRNKYPLSLTAAAAAWGVATVISKRAIAEIPPLTLLPVQLFVSVGGLAMVIRAQRLRLHWSPELRRLGALGILNPGVSYALSLVGLSYISASLSVLLWAIEPLMILALAWWLLREPVTGRMAAAAALALAGVVLLILVPGSRGQVAGIVLTLAGVWACAVYTVISRKLLHAESTLAIVAIQQFCALVFSLVLLAAATAINRTTIFPEASAGAWISAVVAGILYYAVAFWFYLNGLRGVPAAVAGAFINLIPIFGIAAGYILLAERLSGRQWLGAFLIVIAVGSIGLRQSPNST